MSQSHNQALLFSILKKNSMPDIFVPDQKHNQKSSDKEANKTPPTIPNIQNTLDQTRKINSNSTKQTDKSSDDSQLSSYDLNTEMGFFTSICKNPQGINFINQEENEKIIIFVREHFITNFGWIIPGFFALFIPPLIIIIVNILNLDLISASNDIVIIFIIFYYLVLLGYMFTSFLRWFFNIGIVTEKRMIDIDYANILHKNIASVHIAEVIDTEIIQKGFLQGYFNYGDILIQTVGIKPNFEFLATPRPHLVSDIIHDLMSKVKKRI